MTAPRSAPDAHRVSHPRLAHDAVDRDHARRLRVRVDAQHIGAHLGEQIRHHEARRAVGEVQDELYFPSGVATQPERLDDVGGVELDGAR